MTTLLSGASGVDDLEAWLRDRTEDRTRSRRERQAKTRALMVALWRYLAPLVVFLGALACIVGAAFMASPILGLVAAGAALLVVEFRVHGR